MKILAYDVETANSSRSSICAVGWVLVNNDVVIDKGGSFINPQCRFSERNINVHGILPEYVADAPSFAEYWNSTLASLTEKTLVISYNASFDIGATKKALEAAGVPVPDIDYMDIFAVMKRCVQADSYKLHDLATIAGFSYQVHDPIEDAEAIIRLTKYVAKQAGYDDMIELLVHSQIPVQNARDTEPTPPPAYHAAPMAHETYFDGITPVGGCLSGLRFCLTGDVPGTSREDIENLIIQCGGKPTTSVSGKTDYLVVGVYEDFGPGFVSSKQKKAMEMIDQGAKIKIIDFKTLAEMIKGNTVE